MSPLLSATASAKNSEECSEISIGAYVTVTIEVSIGRAGFAAVACQAGEKRFDIGVSAEVTVAVEVGGTLVKLCQ